VPVQSGPLPGERTRAFADRFLEEMRADIQRAISAGNDTLPRLRCIHERAGHATPEFRTLVIPPPPGAGALSPDALSRAICFFAMKRSPDRLLLAMDAVQQDEEGGEAPVLIAEARDTTGTRLFWMQTYRTVEGTVLWDGPVHGGWVNPGDEEMILDAAFTPAAVQRTGTSP